MHVASHVKLAALISPATSQPRVFTSGEDWRKPPETLGQRGYNNVKCSHSLANKYVA